MKILDSSMKLLRIKNLTCRLKKVNFPDVTTFFLFIFFSVHTSSLFTHMLYHRIFLYTISSICCSTADLFVSGICLILESRKVEKAEIGSLGFFSVVSWSFGLSLTAWTRSSNVFERLPKMGAEEISECGFCEDFFLLRKLFLMS